jgi:hypothetical protein
MKIVTVFHLEILLWKKVRNWNAPEGREGARGNRGFPLETGRHLIILVKVYFYYQEKNDKNIYMYNKFTNF